jgi:hypothetical protein
VVELALESINRLGQEGEIIGIQKRWHGLRATRVGGARDPTPKDREMEASRTRIRGREKMTEKRLHEDTKEDRGERTTLADTHSREALRTQARGVFNTERNRRVVGLHRAHKRFGYRECAQETPQ